MRITALMDNKSADPSRFTPEHGLSFYIEYGGKAILFDCGQTGAFLENAQKLGIDLRQADGVVLSHGHYDHAGGYRHFVEAEMPCKELYVGKDFLVPKYACKEGQVRSLAPDWDQAFLEARGIRCHTVEDVLELFPGAYLITGFPRVHEFEQIPARFVQMSASGFRQDDFHDEICLALETGKGIALVVGCSHPGILNMVRHVHNVLGRPVRAVFGGSHLMEAEEDRIRVTVAGLKEMGLEVIGLSHCSGEQVLKAIAEMADVKSGYLAAGDSIDLAERVPL